MLTKIVSGGQTGVDRAALDAAIELDIHHGGWVPKGRRAEDGVIDKKYKLKEMPTDSYEERTKQNVIDSDGTLIVSLGELSGGSKLTRNLATQYKRPWLHIDMKNSHIISAVRKIKPWIVHHKIKVLNVAGPRASDAPEIYQIALKLFRIAFYLDSIGTNEPESSLSPSSFPKTIDEAVALFISELPLKDRIKIAHMDNEALIALEPALGPYIRNSFGLPYNNTELMAACRSLSGENTLSIQEASALIIEKLWENLQKTHILRRVK